MQVADFTICRGITGAARQLGVSYVHLWKVLTGKYESPSLILKINREMPELFDSCLCRIDHERIVKLSIHNYIWDNDDKRYYKKPTRK